MHPFEFDSCDHVKLWQAKVVMWEKRLVARVQHRFTPEKQTSSVSPKWATGADTESGRASRRQRRVSGNTLSKVLGVQSSEGKEE